MSLEISVFERKRIRPYLAAAQGTRLKVDLGGSWWLRSGGGIGGTGISVSGL
jgi:hypothetical protein